MAPDSLNMLKPDTVFINTSFDLNLSHLTPVVPGMGYLNTCYRSYLLKHKHTVNLVKYCSFEMTDYILADITVENDFQLMTKDFFEIVRIKYV